MNHKTESLDGQTMNVQFYQILHVLSMILATAFTFQIFANPDPARRRYLLMLTGVFATLMLIGGFGLLAAMKLGFPLWIIFKIICWFGLASISGMAYRMPNKIPALTWTTIALIVVAITAVYFKFGTGSLE